MKRPGYGNLLGSRDTHSTKPQKVDSGTTHLFSRLLFCCRRRRRRHRHASQLGQMAKILSKTTLRTVKDVPGKDSFERPRGAAEGCFLVKDAKTVLERPRRSCKDTSESFQDWNIIDGPQHTILKKLVKLTNLTYA